LSLRLEREEEVVEAIKKSREAIGPIYPVVIDEETGEIVDGYHRKKADPSWPETKRKFKNEIEKLVFRIVANSVRRTVSKKERKAEMIRLARLLERQGVPKEQICQKICELLKEALSERYIRQLLPAKYKEPRKVKAAKTKTVWRVGAEEKPKKQPAETRKPQKLKCPVCGALLKLVGDMLWPYEEEI